MKMTFGHNKSILEATTRVVEAILLPPPTHTRTRLNTNFTGNQPSKFLLGKYDSGFFCYYHNKKLALFSKKTSIC